MSYLKNKYLNFESLNGIFRLTNCLLKKYFDGHHMINEHYYHLGD